MKQKHVTKWQEKGDIRYRGPLSYSAFKLLGWVCLSFYVVVEVLKLAGFMHVVDKAEIAGTIGIFEDLRQLSLPFFLLGNFAIIIDNKNGYNNQLIRYGLYLVLYVAGFELIFYRYILGTSNLLTGGDTFKDIMNLFSSYAPYGYLDINIFVDLFLCTLFMYFLNVRPKRFFKGKRLRYFRSFALIPIVYEAASLTLKGLCATGKVSLPAYVFPLLTVKPPMTFAVFIVLALFVKTRERRFRKLGYSHEEYREFLKTRRNSLHFSVFTALIMFFAGLIDVILDVELESGGVSFAKAIGLGAASSLTILSPLMLLFSYTRRNKNKLVDLIIPIIGMSLMAWVALEGLYRVMAALRQSADLAMIMELQNLP